MANKLGPLFCVTAAEQMWFMLHRIKWLEAQSPHGPLVDISYSRKDNPDAINSGMHTRAHQIHTKWGNKQTLQ